MAKYTGTVLTNKGKELLARAILGEAIVFTKVEIGKGILSPGTDKETLTSLIDSFKILSITSTTNLPNGGYRIRISFNNKGFTQDTYLREVGVFARGEDGTEILYSYCNTDTPNLIPNEPSGKIEIVEDIITYISSAATINAVVDQSNVYATIKDLVEGLATKEDKFNKNGAFNKPFGTISGTVMEGNKRASDLGGEPAFTKKDAFNRSFSHVISSTSKVLVASAYAVKTAYDKGVTALTKATSAQNTANSAQTKANQAYTLASGKEPKFSKKTGWNLDISHLINSASKTLVASAFAVKTAYEKALEAIGLANTNKNAIQNNTEQIEILASGKEPKITKKTGFNLNKSDSVTSTSTILLATAKAVKTAYDKGVSALNKANQAYNLANGKEPKFTKNSAFNKAFSHVVTSTSKVLVASAYAVKLAYDKGVSALNLANTNKNAIHNNTEQIENLSDFSNNIEIHYDNSSTSYNIKMTGHPKVGYAYFAHNNAGRSAELIWTGKKTQQRVYAAYNESDYYEVRSDGTFKSGSGQGGFTYVFSYKKITK